MTSELVKNQLRSLEIACPDSYDKETNSYHIPKYTGPILEVGKTYFIKEKSSNKYYRISINSKSGRQFYCDAIETDSMNLMSGKVISK